MRKAVKSVADHFPTAIISGRSRDKVIKNLHLNTTWCFFLVHLLIHTYKIEVWLAVILQVYNLVELTELYYAGSHGMDIMGPVNNSVSNDHPSCVKSTDQQVRCFFWRALLLFSPGAMLR